MTMNKDLLGVAASGLALHHSEGSRPIPTDEIYQIVYKGIVVFVGSYHDCCHFGMYNGPYFDHLAGYQPSYGYGVDYVHPRKHPRFYRECRWGDTWRQYVGKGLSKMEAVGAAGASGMRDFRFIAYSPSRGMIYGYDFGCDIKIFDEGAPNRVQ